MSAKKTPSAEQQAIIDAPLGDDILVVAGAGSGKTFTMTERIIHMIERGVPAEKILGLTFTRKAASELLSRVTAAVAANRKAAGEFGGSTRLGGGAENVGNAGNAENAGNAGNAENVGSSGDAASAAEAFMKPEVQTYDAFFQGIVRQYGLLVGFDQNTQPLSDAGAKQLIATVLDDNMDLLFGRDFEVGAFSALVGDVYALSNDIANSMIGGDCGTFEEAAARIHAWDRGFLEYLDAVIGEDAVAGSAGVTKKPDPGKGDYEKKLQRWAERNLKKAPQIAASNAAAMRDATKRRELLLDLAERFTQAKRERHMAEFSDFTVAAYQLLTRFPSIGAKYRRQYSHVLLDEYQDTSTTQAALLALLFHPGEGSADGGGFSGGGYANVGTERSAVCAVGDPFQSIYAWRGASPGAFRLFARDFELPAGYRPLPITVTRRNSKTVLEAANNLTETLRRRPRRESSSLMREVDVAPLATVPNAPEGTLGVLGFATVGLEADGVARFAQEALAQRRLRIAAGEERDEPGAPVAVLFRSKKLIPIFARALEERGLKVQVVGYSALLERPEVRDVLALLAVVADHADSLSLMRLLATPRFGIGADDLERLAKLAARENETYQFQMLVQAGLADPDAGDAERRAAIKEHRNRLPNAIFLIDLMMDEGFEALIDGADGGDGDDGAGSGNGASRNGSGNGSRGASGGFTPAGRAAFKRASRMLREAQNGTAGSLAAAVRRAAEALDIDIDVAVAGALNAANGGSAANVGGGNPIDAVLGLVNAYVQEMAGMVTPTLRGFLAWVDDLKNVPDDALATLQDEGADVVLMTVHQSKGLEWDAVAVVGLEARNFPSSQGDNLTVETVGYLTDPFAETFGEQLRAARREEPQSPESPTPASGSSADGVSGNPSREEPGAAGSGSSEGGVSGNWNEEWKEIWDETFGLPPTYGEAWRRPEYEETATTWLTTPTAVPVPVRVDAAILPRFPHTAPVDIDPVTMLKDLPADATLLDDEVFGTLREPASIANGEPDAWLQRFPTQCEETGTRLHADERRLMYVALTRAKYDALLAYSETAEEGRSVDVAYAPGKRRREPSDFWVETFESMRFHRGVDSAGRPVAPVNMPGNLGQPLPSAPVPYGYFIGEAAQGYCDAVIGGAWNEPIQDSGDASNHLPWPCPLPAETGNRLAASARAAASGSSAGGTLLQKARRLLMDRDLAPARAQSEAALDRDVERKAAAVLGKQRTTVTTLQAHSGDLGEAERAEYFRGVVRPVPRVSSAAASAGTRLHAWAQRYFEAGDPDALVSREAMEAQVRAEAGAQRSSRHSQQTQAAQATEGTEAAPATREQARETQWKERLIGSRWAQRELAWAERSIVMALEVPGASGAATLVVPGKLDAVFRGGLDPADESKTFTIVDWKTGRKPREAADIETKLRQLDYYRLLLARIEGVPLESIDATLYYLSEADEAARELHARGKTEAQILAELAGGVPRISDDD